MADKSTRGILGGIIGNTVGSVISGAINAATGGGSSKPSGGGSSSSGGSSSNTGSSSSGTSRPSGGGTGGSTAGSGIAGTSNATSGSSTAGKGGTVGNGLPGSYWGGTNDGWGDSRYYTDNKGNYIAYDSNKDYSAMISDAVSRGDYQSAAVYEAYRNAKIANQGLPYEQTNNYSQYLPMANIGFNDGTWGSSGGSSGGGSGGTAENPYLDMMGEIGWNNPYAEQIQQALAALNQPYVYDPNNPQAQAVRENYTQAGQQAMENTLAQVSARTGGLASSYAGTAAQQQYNNYMQGMNDALLAVEQQAKQNWLADQGLKQANLQLLLSMASQDENSYYNALNAQMAAQQYKDDLSYRQWQQQFSQQEYLNQLMHQNWQQGLTEDQWEFEKQQYQNSLASEDRQYAYETVMGILQTGQTPSAELLATAGLSLGDAQLLANYYKQQMVAAATGGGSGDGGGYGGGSSGGAKEEAGYQAPWLQAYGDGIRNEDDAISYFIDKGYTFDESIQLATSFMNALNSGAFIGENQGIGKKNMDSLVLQIRNILGAKKPDMAMSVLDGKWNKMSDEERQTMQSVLYQFGYQYNG